MAMLVLIMHTKTIVERQTLRIYHYWISFPPSPNLDETVINYLDCPIGM